LHTVPDDRSGGHPCRPLAGNRLGVLLRAAYDGDRRRGVDG
jgi:hypothetical protein